MSGSSFKCCSNLSALEPSSCGAKGAHFLMEMCQGIRNWEKLLFAIHALAQGASEHVTAIKKRERKCTELADVSGSVPALAGICSRRTSWQSCRCTVQCWAKTEHSSSRVRNWTGLEIWTCGFFLEYILIYINIHKIHKFSFSVGFSILSDGKERI